jgi:hypothetical protein
MNRIDEELEMVKKTSIKGKEFYAIKEELENSMD